jgi:hypothetical protein
MSASNYFGLLAAIYFAPHMSKQFATLLGVASVAIQILLAIKELAT